MFPIEPSILHPVLPNNAVNLVKNYLLNLQNNICATLENLDTKAKFLQEQWTNGANSGGYTRVMTSGKIFSKVGVNFSHVNGAQLPAAASAKRPQLQDYLFQALGISIIVHPDNPYIPTTHANIRFFLAEHPTKNPLWWFGGGFDLTPYYPFIEDCIHWHQTAKAACDPFGIDIYPSFKAWCDKYFYLEHRQEARGIGGLFFDDFSEQSFEHSFSLARSIGEHFILAYAPIVEKRKNMLFTTEEKNFQLYRRGRYVEFNLLYDRGTLFGLQSKGRTESILMSLPPEVNWLYNWQPEKNSREAKLYTEFLPPRDWIQVIPPNLSHKQEKR